MNIVSLTQEERDYVYPKYQAFKELSKVLEQQALLLKTMLDMLIMSKHLESGTWEFGPEGTDLRKKEV